MYVLIAQQNPRRHFQGGRGCSDDFEAKAFNGYLRFLLRCIIHMLISDNIDTAICGIDKMGDYIHALGILG